MRKTKILTEEQQKNLQKAEKIGINVNDNIYKKMYKREFDDKMCSIDDDMDQAIEKIDWERREFAEQNLVNWVKAYCCDGMLLDDQPPEKGEQVLLEMENAINRHTNYCILMPRGHGKSSYILCTTLYAIVTGKQKYIVIISHDARAASSLMSDLWRIISDPTSTFANDYPEISLPFTLQPGSYRRRQLFNMRSTDLQKTTINLTLPTLYGMDKKNKKLAKSSGSLIQVRGISGGLRGMKKGTMRPSLVLLDDLQTSEIAENPKSVDKLMKTIQKDIIPLAGKQRLSILQTATQICQDDLVDKIKNDKSWKTSTYKAIISMPKNLELWKQYFEIYDEETVSGNNHSSSLSFYRENKEEMDEGSEVFNPTRYCEEDGHISCIQKMMELRHQIGNAAFQAEYQMSPVKISYSLDISPKDVIKNTTTNEHLYIPDGYTYVVASTDLNLSKYLTTVVVAFKPDTTGLIIHYEFAKCRIDLQLPDIERNQKIYSLLTEHGKHLANLGVKINAWGIDAGGTPFDAVCEFAKNSNILCGIPACAMVGRANHIFNGFIKSRLRNEINKTVLCGDAKEHVKSGAGYKYIFWSSDYYRYMAQKAFLAEQNSIGSLNLFKSNKNSHSEFAIQFTNEKLLYIQHKPDGKDIYSWKTKDPHDTLDAVAQSFAIAGSQGISGTTTLTNEKKSIRQKNIQFKRKVRFV